MSRWRRGEAVIERLLAGGDLQRVTGGEADGKQWLVRARRTLASAAALTDTDPDSAYVLAYDAARIACTALLQQQGLRPTTTGGHYAVDVAVREQFSGPFAQFGGLRRQRHELEYRVTIDSVASDDALAAVALTTKLVDAAEDVLPHLGLFGQAH